jgi:hypothetical protein
VHHVCAGETTERVEVHVAVAHVSLP